MLTSPDAGTQDQAGHRARLPYWPALDGLRGLAVAAVLLFHSDARWAPGGFLGVSLFFTLSGFLITSLVVAEHGGTGTVGLKAFWARRARRLLPASLLALLLAVVVAVIVLPVEQRPEVMGDVRAALLNVANWRFVLQGTSYADLDLVASPVQHYWSLAIEEQFYIVFPLLAAIALRSRVRTLGILLGAVVVASLGAQLVLDGTDRVYYGTDTRAAELAIGGLLALLLPALSRHVGPRLTAAADVAGIVGLGAMLVLWAAVDQQTPALYQGGLALVAVVSSLLIVGAVSGRLAAIPLRVRPLVELGKVSYGVYLFHFPLYLLLTEERLGLSAPLTLVVRVAATLGLALGSFHLLEMPIRTGRRLVGMRVAAPALALTAALVVGVSIPVGSMDQGRDGLVVGDVAAGIEVVPVVPVPVVAPPVTAAPDPVPPGVGAEPGEPGEPVAAAPTAPVAPAPPPRPPRIVVVGDSTADGNGVGLQKWGERTGRLEVSTVSSLGCAVLSGPRFRVRDGYEYEPQGCDVLLSTAAEQARAIAADAIVVFIGSSQLADWQLVGQDGWQHIGEVGMDAAYEVALAGAAQTLGAAGVPVLWADVPVPDWDLDAFGTMVGAQMPGSGPVSLNSPERTARLNDIDARALPLHPLVQRWPYAATMTDPNGEVPRSVRPDGLHVSEEGMAALAEAGLMDRLAKAYAAVVARAPAGLRSGAPHAWSVSASG